MRFLAINPGSTSTKIAVYDDLKPKFTKTLRHSAEEISKYATIFEQFPFRKELIISALKENDIELSSIDAVVGRGGLLRPIPGGVYKVNVNMLKDLEHPGTLGEHASNLGGIIAFEIAQEIGKNTPAFIADPVVVDELEDIARYSGHPALPRISIFHALNQKAVARRYAKEINREYNDLDLIVVHLGGGVSVGVHNHGRVIDVNNALNGGGPMSPERAGSLPTASLVELCFSGKYQKAEILKMITGKGGCVAFLGTNDMYEIEIKSLEKGDKEAMKILNAFIYQVAKEIGFIAPVLSGKLDAILITGGIANSKYVCEEIEKRVEFIAPVKIYPGEDEMQALTESAYYALQGKYKVLDY
jgi:butyrate kinase